MKSAIGLFVSWLAAWCQVVMVAAIPLGPFIASSAPLGEVPICHAGADDQRAPSQPNHPQHDCILCAVCAAHGGAIGILSESPALPARQVVAVALLDSVQPRAPPVRGVFAAQPRGPPSLI
jgi:hypothetical protein